jgi:hypothetical protein
MLLIDIPSLEQFKPLAQVKRETCISTYVHTSRLGTDDKLNRLAFKNLAKAALSRLREGGADRAKMAAFESQLDSLAGPERDIQDEDKIRKLQRAKPDLVESFWHYQSHGLGVLATTCRHPPL